MITCKNCGSVMEDDAKFCEVCGSVLNNNLENNEFVSRDNKVSQNDSDRNMSVNTDRGIANEQKKPSQRKWIKIVIAAVLLAVVGIGGYFGIQKFLEYREEQDHISEENRKAEEAEKEREELAEKANIHESVMHYYMGSANTSRYTDLIGMSEEDVKKEYNASVNYSAVTMEDGIVTANLNEDRKVDYVFITLIDQISTQAVAHNQSNLPHISFKSGIIKETDMITARGYPVNIYYLYEPSDQTIYAVVIQTEEYTKNNGEPVGGSDYSYNDTTSKLCSAYQDGISITMKLGGANNVLDKVTMEINAPYSAMAPMGLTKDMVDSANAAAREEASRTMKDTMMESMGLNENDGFYVASYFDSEGWKMSVSAEASAYEQSFNAASMDEMVAELIQGGFTCR